jgi:hypothetical protein
MVLQEGKAIRVRAWENDCVSKGKGSLATFLCRSAKDPEYAGLTAAEKLQKRNQKAMADCPPAWFPDFWLTFLLRGLHAGVHECSDILMAGTPLDRSDLGMFNVPDGATGSPTSRLGLFCSSKQRAQMRELGVQPGLSDSVRKLPRAQADFLHPLQYPLKLTSSIDPWLNSWHTHYSQHMQHPYNNNAKGNRPWRTYKLLPWHGDGNQVR